MSDDNSPIRVKTIAIVGAGPSGVAAVKYLLAEKAFDRITVFEQRSGPGGIWEYTPYLQDEDMFSIPQTDPNKGQQNPYWKLNSSLPAKDHMTNGTTTKSEDGPDLEPSFLSPLYGALETNIPRHIMAFQGLDWPSDTQLFPPHATVLKYIDDYTKDVEHLIQYETQVIDVVPTSTNNTNGWNLKSYNIRTREEKEERFDAVIVANGHYTVPYVPNIDGAKEWNERHPGRITHSKYFRRAEDFTNKKVLVIGAFASGADISQQIAPHCQKPLLWSSRGETQFTAGVNDPTRKPVPEVIRFVPETRGVVFKDGTRTDDIDAVLFCTGYFFSFPFLEKVQPKLITDGSHVHHTYQHVFFRPNPTLSFLVLNQRVIPFRLAEAQATVIARVYSGRLTLPSTQIMENWERDTIAEMGDGRAFHVMLAGGTYVNMMSRWAMEAPRRRAKQDGWAGEPLENDGQGKIPPFFSEEDIWCREQFPAMRRAFAARREDRVNVKFIEDLGFSYKKYLEEKEKGKEEQVGVDPKKPDNI